MEQFPVPIEQFWLFGSYAKNNAHKDSDIDIALVVNHLDKNYSVLNTEPILWKLKRQIDFRIEPHVIVVKSLCTSWLKNIKSTNKQKTKSTIKKKNGIFAKIFQKGFNGLRLFEN